MLGINKSSKTMDIKLVEEKYYFPGQPIKGFVIVQPKSHTKTNHITLKFTGEVALSLKEKDAICLFQKTKVINVAPYDEQQLKPVIMEPKLHSFPFEFVVPGDIQVPSTMEFNKKARIRYTLSAVHDKPMVPESLCPKAEYPVHILEFIDTNDAKYRVPQDKISKMFLPISNPVNLCSIRASLPRYGFTRGDIVPLSLIIHHFEPFVLPQAIDISLIRTVEIRNNKNNQVKEDILKSTTCDIEINDTPHYSQAIKRQLLIPTSTPPSINFRNDMLQIQYKVRICTQFTMPSPNQHQQEKKTCNVDIPIVVGTWPRAAIPIDDDDDDDDDYQNDTTMEDTDFIDITGSISDSEGNYHHDYSNSGIISDDRNSNTIHFSQQQLDRLRSTSTTESSSANSSSSTIKLTAKLSSLPSPPHAEVTTINNNDVICRSDSLASKASSKSYSSYSSYRSSQSWETSSASLSRNTSLSTNISLPDSCKTTSAIAAAETPSSSASSPETILMTASPSCFNTATSINNNKNNNKYVSPFSQHRGSDPTGMATHSPIQQRHSFYNQERRQQQHQQQQHQQYPVLVGPSPSKYRKHQSAIFPSSNSTTTSTASVYHQHCRSSSMSSSFYDQCSSSSFSLTSCRSVPVPAPTQLLSPTSTDTILLQPVGDDDGYHHDNEVKTVISNNNKKEHVLIGTTTQPSPYDEPSQHQHRHHLGLDLELDEEEDDDDDDDDEDDDDFLTIVRRKQEQTLLDERTRLHMAEMKI
ncbi:unnamed protein product [Absidia cylindrospora]